MDTISVIVPVYNIEGYLGKCIDSIIAQTYKDLEIILVDDGSPDNCGAICDEYAKKDSRIKVIHKPNGGLSDARNHGIEAATGRYLGFVDGDDYIEPEMYEKLYNALVENDADISICSFRYVGGHEDRNRLIPILDEIESKLDRDDFFREKHAPLKARYVNFARCYYVMYGVYEHADFRHEPFESKLRLFSKELKRRNKAMLREPLSVSQRALLIINYISPYYTWKLKRLKDSFSKSKSLS